MDVCTLLSPNQTLSSALPAQPQYLFRPYQKRKSPPFSASLNLSALSCLHWLIQTLVLWGPYVGVIYRPASLRGYATDSYSRDRTYSACKSGYQRELKAPVLEQRACMPPPRDAYPHHTGNGCLRYVLDVPVQCPSAAFQSLSGTAARGR